MSDCEFPLHLKNRVAFFYQHIDTNYNKFHKVQIKCIQRQHNPEVTKTDVALSIPCVKEGIKQYNREGVGV